MKTVYLLGWLVNAILIATLVPDKESFTIILKIWNVVIPCALLIMRMILIHQVINEDKMHI